MGLDHPWIEDHPEYFIQGTELDLARAPQNYTWVKRQRGDLLLAYGRDPYFSGWPDTLQLNYANPATQEAMIGELVEDRRPVRRRALRHGHAGLARRFRTHLGPACPALLAEGDPARARACSRLPLHGRGLLGPGMDAAATGLRLRLRQAALRPPARAPRPAGARAFPRGPRLPGQAGPLPGEPRRAAGRGDVSRRKFTKPRPSSRSCRRGCDSSTRDSSKGGRNGSRRIWAAAPTNRSTEQLAAFYDRLLAVLRQPVVRDGQWQLLECAPAWDGNWTNDCFLAFAWQGPEESGCWSR